MARASLEHRSPPALRWLEWSDCSLSATLGSLNLRVVPTADGRCARFLVLLPEEGADRFVASGTENDVESAMRAAAHTAKRLLQLVDGWRQSPAGPEPAARPARSPTLAKPKPSSTALNEAARRDRLAAMGRT